MKVNEKKTVNKCAKTVLKTYYIILLYPRNNTLKKKQISTEVTKSNLKKVITTD